MNPEEQKANLHSVITAHATQNPERAQELFHDVLQAKMQQLMRPEVDAVDADEDTDIDPENPDAGE